MNRSDFTNPSTGALVPTLGQQLAFVPAALPPTLDLGRIALSLAEAMGALGELKGACRRLPNPDMLVRPLQRNEALTSSAMEGTFTTGENLLAAEAGHAKERDESNREVFNYLDALNTALERMKTLPISHRVIQQAHEILLSGLGPERGARKRPGQYKLEQNWIGGRTIDVARFVPPPPAETRVCMDELERYINREDIASPLIDLALVHYQIEAIHPFADGNGRIGRMLISLMAVQGGLLDRPVLYISPVLERQKSRYIDLMYAVSTSAAWEDWINFFCECVCESCRETVSTIDRLIELQDRYRQLSLGMGRSSSATQLVDFLFERPAVSVREAADKLGLTYPAARSTIEKLVGAGILVEMDGFYPKLFYSPSIMRASRPVTPDL